MREIYGTELISERHRHRYEVNNNYVGQLQAVGMRVAGWSDDRSLVEIIELPAHPGLLPVSSTLSLRLGPVAGTHCSPVTSKRR